MEQKYLFRVIKKNEFLEKRIPPLPAYWIITKFYYPNGIIKGLYSARTPIEIRQYFDLEGNLIKEEDCDKRYGKLSYEHVLKFLREKEHLGEDNAGIENIIFFLIKKKNFGISESI